MWVRNFETQSLSHVFQRLWHPYPGTPCTTVPKGMLICTRVFKFCMRMSFCVASSSSWGGLTLRQLEEYYAQKCAYHHSATDCGKKLDCCRRSIPSMGTVHRISFAYHTALKNFHFCCVFVCVSSDSYRAQSGSLGTYCCKCL